jgi:hypothetical protein
MRAGCLDALLNAYDQEEWWKACGSRGECKYDGAAAVRSAHGLVREVARVLHEEQGTVVLVRAPTPSAAQLAFVRGHRREPTVITPHVKDMDACAWHGPPCI